MSMVWEAVAQGNGVTLTIFSEQKKWRLGRALDLGAAHPAKWVQRAWRPEAPYPESTWGEQDLS